MSHAHRAPPFDKWRFLRGPDGDFGSALAGPVAMHSNVWRNRSHLNPLRDQDPQCAPVSRLRHPEGLDSIKGGLGPRKADILQIPVAKVRQLGPGRNAASNLKSGPRRIPEAA
jgi:hypothetical protein